MEGFVKLYRQIFDWEWYTDPNTSRLFIHLILKANHKEVKYRGNTIRCGQTLTSINTLSNELGLSHDKIRRAIKNLISTGEITVQTTNRYSMITISKYRVFHENCEDDHTQTTNKTHSNHNQTTTNKNDKNDKNENNIINISQWQKYYLSDSRILNAVKDNNNMTIDFIKKNIVMFVRTQNSTGNTERTIIEFNTHFLNYLRKAKKNVGKKKYHGGSYSNDVL